MKQGIPAAPYFMSRTPPLLEWWKRVVCEAEKKRAARAAEGSEHATGL